MGSMMLAVREWFWLSWILWILEMGIVEIFCGNGLKRGMEDFDIDFCLDDSPGNYLFSLINLRVNFDILICSLRQIGTGFGR
jgi:hypothetical protein